MLREHVVRTVMAGVGVASAFGAARVNADDTIPPGWYRIGVATTDDHQQNFVVGDFTDKSGVEMITCYSHGNIGIFHHYQVPGGWDMTHLNPLFEPASFFENFDEGWNPPANGWESSDWYRSEDQCLSPPASMYFDSSDGFDGETLVSPAIDLTQQSKPMLKVFWWNPNSGMPGDAIDIDISTDGGANYDPIGSLGDSGEGWNKMFIDLSAYSAATNARIKFTGVGTYDPSGTNPHLDHFWIITDYDYTWPVKGIVGGDFDADGRLELVSRFDVVVYPPNPAHNYPFPYPGAIYIDWNAVEGFTARALIWGVWGEEISSTAIANSTPIVLSNLFRTGGAGIGDVLVPTVVGDGDDPNGVDARVFLLEQPVAGWNTVDYTSGGGLEPYHNEPDYVKHLWVDNGSMDEELYWESDDVTPDENVMSGGLAVAEMIRPGDLGSGIAVAGNYLIGGSEHRGRISLYKRLASQGEHEYRFEEIAKFWINDAELQAIAPANLDGDAANGQESFIVTYHDTGVAQSDLGGGFLCVEPDNSGGPSGEYKLTSLYVDNEDCYPYVRPYSNVAVLDRNGDGFDDMVVYLMVTPARGDLVYFQNVGDNLLFDDSRFAHAPGYYEVLWEDDGFELMLDLADADGDEILELVAGLARKDPTGDPEGTYKTYYYNIFEEDFHPAPLPGDFEPDGDVDLSDFDEFELCFTGPSGGSIGAGCAPGDFDCDDDVDCFDWASFVEAWTEPEDPPEFGSCGVAIPAASEWGVAVMALVILSAGALIFIRRTALR